MPQARKAAAARKASGAKHARIWSLSNPKIAADFLLLDEAQDTNPVVEQIFNNQRAHAQLVMVGDSAQAIYQWRGAKDVMTTFDGTHLALSHSFRFGPRLAHEANRWLAIAGAPTQPELAARPEHVDEVLAVLGLGHVDAPNQLWEMGFEQAQHYHAEHGDLDVASRHKTSDRFYLGWWPVPAR
ncbi:hypothetical protein T261_0006 [Streptomyces lydicus]|nr:hypothetical protein T261_0006 [Streptomyces lydicus]